MCVRERASVRVCCVCVHVCVCVRVIVRACLHMPFQDALGHVVFGTGLGRLRAQTHDVHAHTRVQANHEPITNGLSSLYTLALELNGKNPPSLALPAGLSGY